MVQPSMTMSVPNHSVSKISMFWKGVYVFGNPLSDPADQPGSHNCCHRAALVVSGTGTSCCQIENVPHAATSPDLVVVAQPVFASTPVLELATCINAPFVKALACSSSPPGRILRV
jgi:hypothetical protein